MDAAQYPWSPAQQRAIREVIGTHGSPPIEDDADPYCWPTILTRLRLLIPADEVATIVLDTAHRSVQRAIGVPREIHLPHGAAFQEAFWHECWEPAASPPAESAGVPDGALQPNAAFGDGVLPAQVRRTRLHAILGDLAEVHVMFATLVVSADTEVRVMFLRQGHGFSGAERLMLDLLTPYLLQRCRRAGTVRAQTCLTDRQRQVLLLAARGCSGTDIAHRLQVSPATVRKHLENIYYRLGASNRATAVLRAFPHGVPSP